MQSNSLNKQATLYLLLFAIIPLQNIHAAPSCVYCGEGTEYPSCFEIDFIKKKVSSVLQGCIDINRDKKLESEVETQTSVRNERLEIKLMEEFCSDPSNNQGTACTKFHYSRIGKSDDE
ncbi:MAG: hypothetical protein HQL46_06810 [Gammaproteobacteria bacterium]|nr:hypothetical protein [Gammaproteobacteria bacterium]